MNCLVFAALVLTVGIPPLFVAWRLTPAGNGWLGMLNALALGCASQGIIGLFWDRLVLRNPYGEIALYYACWAAISIIATRLRRSPPAKDPAGRAEFVGVGMILLGALVVRSIHPLGHAALGQSDAYSHLQFIRQVLADGMIHNQIYPPAFSWIMALPAATFRLDPYELARFGGAFWGAALSLAIYGLGRFSGRKAAGLIAAALVAFCPAWMPLLKTGVGVFANQLGLYFLPLVLLFYLGSGRNRSLGLLLILSMALVSTVPMMWISLMPVLMVDRVLAAATEKAGWMKATSRVALALLPAILLLGWQSSRIQDNHRAATMTIMTGQEVPAVSPADQPGSGSIAAERPSDTVLLVKNYCSVKRVGYGSPILNLAGLGLGAAFWIALFLGGRQHDPALRLMGIWGLITSIQAATGFMQFSGYQREGWSLLLATAWLGGMIGAGGLAWGGDRKWMRGALVFLLVLCFSGTCWAPPRHPASFSSAEDELIEVARRAADQVQRNGQELPLTIVMRKFSGFHGNQGDVLEAVVGLSGRVTTLAVGPEGTSRGILDPGRQYLFLMDLIPLADHWSSGLFAQVQPEEVEHYMQAQNSLFQLNQQVEEWLDQIPSDQWTREPVETSPHLKGVLVRPIGGPA